MADHGMEPNDGSTGRSEAAARQRRRAELKRAGGRVRKSFGSQPPGPRRQRHPPPPVVALRVLVQSRWRLVREEGPVDVCRPGPLTVPQRRRPVDGLSAARRRPVNGLSMACQWPAYLRPHVGALLMAVGASQPPVGCLLLTCPSGPSTGCWRLSTGCW